MAISNDNSIRTFYIKAHIAYSFHLSENVVYKWVVSQLSRATDILSLGRHYDQDTGLNVIYDDRRDDIEQIRTWLMETADTFVVVQGPRGSGKRELVINQALKGRSNTLVIDCKPVQEARGDSATIRAAAKEVGYRPVFSWMNSVSSLVDLAAQGTIGTKTGFSETLDSQLAKIFQNTATALRQIALGSRKKDDSDKDLGDDEYLEAHPERRPVVVVDNFLYKSNESTIVYDKISEWAAMLTTVNVAHVIFLTHDVSFSKSLSKALPDRVFRQLSLGDCSPEVAKRYVIRHLDADREEKRKGTKEDVKSEQQSSPLDTRDDLHELDECIETLGGRLTDLEFLARRIKSGKTPTSKFFLLYLRTSLAKGHSRSHARNNRPIRLRDPKDAPPRPLLPPLHHHPSLAPRQSPRRHRHHALQRRPPPRPLQDLRRHHPAGPRAGRAHHHHLRQWPPAHHQARASGVRCRFPPADP